MANEKRLIDANAFIDDIKTEIVELWLNGLKGTPQPRDQLYDIINRIDEQPTVDAVEVVRCKDCKWYDADCKICVYLSEDGDTYDFGCDVNMKPDDFCSYGERKDNDKSRSKGQI